MKCNTRRPWVKMNLRKITVPKLLEKNIVGKFAVDDFYMRTSPMV